MRMLSASELLEVWERGQSQHPLDRAITLLAVACPEKSREELIKLSLGQRDTLLFSFRQLFFGSRLVTCSQCPACGTELELAIDIESILLQQGEPQEVERVENISEYSVSFRLPDSALLAEYLNSTGSPDSDLLLRNCILSITRNGEKIDFVDINKDIRDALTFRMAQIDPISEVQINSTCSECGHRWTQVFDIFSFLWSELGMQVEYLLDQVHVLAGSYHWRESDILSLSQWRRQYYLDRATA